MNSNIRKIASFALATTILSSTTPAKAYSLNVPEKIPNNYYVEQCTRYYVVQEGDTLGRISTMLFGSPIYYKELAEYNNIEDPTKIYANQIIHVPEKLIHSLVEPYSKIFEPDQIYEVQEKDHLIDIVDTYYGERSLKYVDLLATYNDLEDPNIIEVGEKLWIPEKEKLQYVEPKDYSLQYLMLEYRINHPGEEYPDWIKEALEEQKQLVLEKENQ